tara:strand:- start:8080 stop:8811 length:732 start_codon:yes stop_codon:yes gene_type:complete
MIKFFRKIRQNSLSDSKFGKYLIYAIGEIILVMIGILLALQVNNWNENRKLQKEEFALLAEVKADLENTLVDFIGDTIYNSNTIELYKKIEYYINKDLPYNIELDSAFGSLQTWDSPVKTSSAYKTLQSKGLDLIKNESIKKEVIKIYEVETVNLIIEYDKTEWALNEIVSPFFAKHIRRLDENSLLSARPNDFESLKRNDEFLNILMMLIRQRRRGLEYYEKAMIPIEKLIDEIDTELMSRR